MTHYTIHINRKQLEGFIWVAALTALIFTDPHQESHYSLCLIKNSGLGFCPGCGIGHSISFLFRGEITQAFKSHPLGFFAVIILIFRIYKIFNINPLFKINKHGSNH